MSDPTGQQRLQALVNSDPNRREQRTGVKDEFEQRMTQKSMTAKERRAYEKENPNSYGPGTLIGRSGRVFNVIPGRDPGTFTGFVNNTLTQERFEGMQREAAGPAKPREPAERTTRRRGMGGGGGSTTLLTADGLGSSRTGQRRTVLGA